MAEIKDSEIDPRYAQKMVAIARTLDEFLNEGKKAGQRETGFVVLVFPFGEAANGRANYISNGADRHEIASLFREMAARFEGMPEVKATRA